MAFPPNFSNQWDITFPPDTQLANLLGQDLRNLRVDVMQRMSLLSGTFANRPTPEILNATWGGAGFGLLYFATDTSQIFQWNGAAWVDVSSSIFPPKAIFKDGVSHNHTGTVTEDTIYTVVINGNSLGVNGVLRGTLYYFTSVQGGVSPTIRIKLGGTLLQAFTSNAPATFASSIDFEIENRNLANSQVIGARFYTGGASATVTVGFGTTAIDTTVNQNLTVTIQNGAATDTQQFNQFILEQL